MGLEPGTTMRRDVEMDSMAKISGRVINQAEQAVQGARVAVMDSLLRPSTALHRILKEQEILALTTTTDDQGEFELFVPPENGEVTLLAGAHGYASSRVGPLPVKRERELGEVVVRLPPGLKVRGRVVGEGGASLSEVTIVAYRGEPVPGGPEFAEIAPRARSGAKGEFLLRGLEKGTYVLKASHATHATQTVREVKVEATTTQVPDIVLKVQGQICGRVVGVTQEPILGASVRGRAGEEFSEELVSDRDGRFCLDDFPPGASVILWAEAPGYSRGEEVVTTPKSDVVIALRPLGVLRGRVEDSITGRPVDEFRIWVARGSEERSFRSEDGSFEWPGLPPGQWTFVAQAPGYQDAEVRGVEIRFGEPTEGVLFLLKKGVKVAGRALDHKSSKGLPDVIIHYRGSREREDSEWARFNRNAQITDYDGSFEFDGVPPGEVTISAHSPFHAEARATLMAGKVDFVEIRLTEGASISGHVIAPDAVSPVSDVLVTLWSVGLLSRYETRTDGSGAFSFDRLVAGQYQLMAEGKLGQAKSREIVLRGDERLGDLILVIAPGSIVRGKVSGVLSGEFPVVNLLVNGQGGFTASTLTDADGVYAVSGVPPGLVKLMAETSAVDPSSWRRVSKSIEVPEGLSELVLDIEFPRTARLYGHIRQAGRPISFANVSAIPVDPQLFHGFCGTDQDGTYLINGLSDGNYVVHVNGKAAVTVRILGDTLLDIELSQFPNGSPN